MYSVNHTDLKSTLSSLAIGLNIPVMVWGQPGVGKSDVARQVADEHGALLIDIRLSQYDSVDLRGIPTANDGLTYWNMPATMPLVGNNAFPDDRMIVLFFDEINSAAPSVMAVAYQLVLDRQCGEHALKPNVRVIAAGNREGDKGVTNKMATPLANRFCHVELSVSAEAMIDHMLDVGAPPEAVAFLSWRKVLVSTFDPAKPEKAFATPRSWMQAFKIFMSDSSPAVKRIGMAGCVGEGPSLEFWAFIDMMAKVIPISRILADPEHCEVPDELSMCYATAVSVSGAMDTKTTAKLHRYLERMDPEFMVLAWQMAIKRDEQVITCPEFVKLSKTHKALFAR